MMLEDVGDRTQMALGEAIAQANALDEKVTLKSLSSQNDRSESSPANPSDDLYKDDANSPVFSAYIRRSNLLPQGIQTEARPSTQGSMRTSTTSSSQQRQQSPSDPPQSLAEGVPVASGGKKANLRDRWQKMGMGVRQSLSMGDIAEYEEEAPHSALASTAERPSRVDANWPRRCARRCPSSLSELATSEGFDYVIAALVILNAVFVGVRADYAITHVDDKEPQVFRIIELCFCGIFVLELGLRLKVHGREYFTHASYLWNMLDLLVVFCQVITELLEWLESTSALSLSWSYLRILRFLRYIRIVRLARLVHIVRELRTMVASVAATMKSLCWTISLIFIMIYIIGVHIVEVINEYARDEKSQGANFLTVDTSHGSYHVS
jgi:hypothetical protein